jgi:putative ABC transport system permease protein
MRDFYVDENYLTIIDAQFVAGEKFEPNIPNQVILNSLGIKRFGYKSPHEAIGQTIYHEDSTYLTVTGVVKDFHIRPLTSAMEPVAFIYDPSKTYMLSVRYSGEPVALAGQLQNIWKEFDTRPLDWRLLSSEIDDAYKSAGLFDLLLIVGYCGFLTITLSCLGVLGMAMANSQAKRKEVAIRKITGATEIEIIHFLIKSFVKILTIAVLIGLPLSIVLIDQFLSLYAYKTVISIFSYLKGIGFVLIAGLTIVISQTYSIAKGNIVSQLQRE